MSDTLFTLSDDDEDKLMQLIHVKQILLQINKFNIKLKFI